jgi:hypothetical protein
MTIEQLLSPAVMDWSVENKHLSKEQLVNEFKKWSEKNIDLINESVKDNIDEINECINQGIKKTKLIMENINEDDDFDWGVDVEDIDDNSNDNSNETDFEDEDENGGGNPDTTISGKTVLTNTLKNSKSNIFNSVNSILNRLERKGISREPNSHIWGDLDVSGVKDMTALFAFSDITNADLSSWNVSGVKCMEGMFYKSTFNNNSIAKWNVEECESFLRMFTYSDFNGDLKYWKYKETVTNEKDENGKPIIIRVTPPLIGASANEEMEIIQKYWDDKYDELENKLKNTKKDNLEKKLEENKKPMKHILDYETFINEGFGDFIKKGFNKIKSLFKNVTMKFGNFITSFDKNGELIKATSPYTTLNYISEGKVKGVSAYTKVKNELLNDNVKSTADIIKNPEYYGIFDKNSIEYQNYLTMVEMVNEHYSKYGDADLLNEEVSGRLTLSKYNSGLRDVPDIDTSGLVEELEDILLNTPHDKGIESSKPYLIWGAPGIGKSSIPNSIIEAWNKDKDASNKKALLVIECGDLTIDGFSIPIPNSKKIAKYFDEHPIAATNIKDQIEEMEEVIKDIEITVSDEAIKSWLPVYEETSDKKLNKIKNQMANGWHMSTFEETEDGKFESVTYETTEGGLIIFDEFFRANTQVFKIVMQILLNRRFGSKFVLGDKWSIIACSNRPGDDQEVGQGYTATGAVVGTRFSKQFNFIPDFNEWKVWAVEKGHFDEGTLTFLQLEKDPVTGEFTNWHSIRPSEYTSGKSGWPVPRTWSELMVELHNIMVNHNYSSISEIPIKRLERNAGAAVGEELGKKYANFIQQFYSGFKPHEILNNPDYKIEDTDLTVSEMVRRISDYINVNFSKKNPPTDDQLMNLFNRLTDLVPKSQENHIRPLYVSILENYGIHEEPSELLKKFKNFLPALAKKYNLLATKNENGTKKIDTEQILKNLQDFCKGDL